MQIIRLFLSLALIALIVSMTPLGDGWQIFVRIQPSMQATDLSAASYAPHEAVAMFIVDVWQAVIRSFEGAGWLAGDRVHAPLTEGLMLSDFLQVIAALFGILAWVRSWSRAANTLAAKTSEQSLPSTPLEPPRLETSREPRLTEEPVFQGSTEEVSDGVAHSSLDEALDQEALRRESVLDGLANRMTDLQMRLTNTTLNPLAQPVVESLVELSRSLQSMRSDLERELNESSLGRQERSVR